jgi:hypothetical protein
MLGSNRRLTLTLVNGGKGDDIITKDLTPEIDLYQDLSHHSYTHTTHVSLV